jgi:hypothetical protein
VKRPIKPVRLEGGPEAERQILIFAAMAAGFRSILFAEGEAFVSRYRGSFWWSPLTQDDQAKKLARRLGIPRLSNEEILLKAAEIGRSMNATLIRDEEDVKTMTITRYAIETDAMCGRAFNCSDYELENGERYQGLYLLRTAEEAEQEIQDEILARDEEEMDDLEEYVTVVSIGADGSIVDQDGSDVLPDLSMQIGLTVDQLKASAKSYYDEEIAQERAPDPVPSF